MKVIAALSLVFLAGLALVARPRQETGAPPRPINLSVRSEFQGAVAVARLKWQDQSENELGFEILRSDDGRDFRVVGSVGANTDRHEDRVGKYVNGTFVYQVRAFNEYGKSEESNAASVWF